MVETGSAGAPVQETLQPDHQLATGYTLICVLLTLIAPHDLHRIHAALGAGAAVGYRSDLMQRK
jgi:phosphatidylserine decarboxylase